MFSEAQLPKVKLSQAYYKTDPCLALTGHIDGGQQVDWLIWPKVSSHMSDQRYKDRERMFNKVGVRHGKGVNIGTNRVSP